MVKDVKIIISYASFTLEIDFNNQGVKYVEILNTNVDQAKDHLFRSSSSSTGKLNQPVISSFKSLKSPSTDRFEVSSSRHHSQIKNGLLTPQPPESPKKRKWRNWRLGTILVFMLCSLIGVVLFFLIPRQPFISYEVPVAFTGDNGSAKFNTSNPTQFSFDTKLAFSFDGRASYVAAILRNLKVSVRDLGSSLDSVEVGKGQLGKSLTISSGGLTAVLVDVHFQYAAGSQSDSIYQAWLKACGNIEKSRINGTVTRPALKLFISLNFNILGVIGQKADSIQQNSISCPIELPN
ncbi:hypothetical protein PPACK8108_LOCUS25182 [Phakopsora pachyrhizi]|uniref:Late embryogenesis abundant protein LEA-2 subgroup domain-containing protein n=1 Tax=Phakopsora pachyrhizi TaxID=170000 RepID=A0AAV0BV66_PHAPC|nr:hypothetical protein PPACK8108_LOCUS25182 [Phakopsora pachyrhizi]